jgi:23S rRNA pseudouridine1911/1915/1917 synthase
MYAIIPAMEPKIIAETNELLVLDKPAGLITHSDGRTKEPSVAEWLFEQYPKQKEVSAVWVSPQGEQVHLAGLVHRLDRGTSGVMLAAKTDEMWAYIKNEMKERRVEKVYRALVYGHMEQNEGKVIAEIMRTTTPPKRWYARPTDTSNRRAAITEWRVLKRFEEGGGNHVSYIEIRPITGRTHQIRIHLSSIGHPVVCDPLYATQHIKLFNLARTALHAYSISFTLPDGARVSYTAPLPPDFPTP